jgi:hypothetical protein
MRSVTIMTVLYGAALLAGCAHSMELPPMFVEVDKADLGGYEFRGISPDGVVLGLQMRDNAKHGTLQFWSEAIKNELTNRGYKHVRSESITSTSGRQGELLSFSTEKSGQKFTYLLAVCVGSRDILMAEAGGKTESVEPRLPDIKKSLLSAK